MLVASYRNLGARQPLVVLGSYISDVASSSIRFAPSPPIAITLPSGSKVSVWCILFSFMGPVKVHVVCRWIVYLGYGRSAVGVIGFARSAGHQYSSARQCHRGHIRKRAVCWQSEGPYVGSRIADFGSGNPVLQDHNSAAIKRNDCRTTSGVANGSSRFPDTG